MPSTMSWLPEHAAWDAELRAARALDGAAAWKAMVALSKHDLNFLETGQLDRAAQKLAGVAFPPAGTERVRMALLGSSTLKHLVPGIRVAGLRRSLWIDVYEGDYGQYMQELLAPPQALTQFAPQFVCLALDAPHLYETSHGDVDACVEALRTCWRRAKEQFCCTVLQQTALPVFADVMGMQEHRMPASPAKFADALNRALEMAADAEGVQLLAVDRVARYEGVAEWHDAAMWQRSRQEVHPRVSQMYGEYVARLIAAQRGRSGKCLVLDLDNTLWGGVVGDEGTLGVMLSAGDAAGESFLAFQRYILQLRERGVILAVCSKNDEANALAVFEENPAMLLKREHIACFVANWEDKAANLRQIAQTLHIGTDALVFADDSAFERNLVRAALPEVAVPEMPEDPALYVETIARGGYFEALTLTEEDRTRAEQYKTNSERDQLRASTTDMESYLKSLHMEIAWRPFDESGLERVVQLMNKTNQFNLTTERYGDAEVRAMVRDPKVWTMQLRLKDRFGEYGVVSLMVARQVGDAMEIDTWLMSCRVLGRGVEAAALNLLLDAARERGVTVLRGVYKPTAKNAMVKDLYERMGFRAMGDNAGENTWELEVADAAAAVCFATVREEQTVTQ